MWKLAFRNIFRRKVRTGLTLLAIISGVIAYIFAGGFIQDILLQVKDATITPQLESEFLKVVAMYKRQFIVLQLIIFGIVFLSVTNSLNMTLSERAGEFGTLRALGNRRNHIFKLAILEAIIIGFLGSILGVILGVLFASLVPSINIPMPPLPNSTAGWSASIRVVPSVVIWAFAIGLIASCLAAILPSLRISRMPITTALRQN